MILGHILSQFRKFVLGNLKYFPDVTCYHSNCAFHVLFTVVYMIRAPGPIIPVRSGACPHLYLHSTKHTAPPQYCH